MAANKKKRTYMYLYRYVFKPDNTYPMSVYITILAVWWTIWYQQLKHFFTDHFNCQINLSQGKCFCIRYLFFIFVSSVFNANLKTTHWSTNISKVPIAVILDI